MSDDDTALLAWTEQTGLKYSLRPLGGGFGPVRTVPASTAYSRPLVTYGADGAARALWVGSNAGRDAVQTTRITADGTSETAQIVSPPSPAPAGANDDIEGFMGLGINTHGDAVADLVAQLRRRARAGVGHALPRPHLGPRLDPAGGRSRPARRRRGRRAGP